MADYYTKAVIQPNIPEGFVTEKEMELLKTVDMTPERTHDGKLYFYTDSYAGGFWSVPRKLAAEVFGKKLPGDPEEEVEMNEDDLFNLFQGIVRRSNGELPYVTISAACLCSRMLSDGFGGFAVFIAADRVKWVSTVQWLHRQTRQESQRHHKKPESRA